MYLFFNRPTPDQLLIDWSTTLNEQISQSEPSTSPDNSSLEGTGMCSRFCGSFDSEKNKSAPS